MNRITAVLAGTLTAPTVTELQEEEGAGKQEAVKPQALPLLFPTLRLFHVQP